MSLEWQLGTTECSRPHASDAAYRIGRMLVVDPKISLPQALNITLFFDGIHNKDDSANGCRDSHKNTHAKVARLRNVALNDTEELLSSLSD